jgi:hypothetical protein
MQFDQFRRRDFVRLLLGGATAWPLATRAQVASQTVLFWLAYFMLLGLAALMIWRVI